MNWALVIGAASPAVALLTIFASAWAGRHAGRAALRQAEATVKQAATDERKAASADWGAYTRELRQQNKNLIERVDHLEKRVEAAEMRAAAADLRATKAEQLYALAIIYLRGISAWVNDHWPGESLPSAPPELEADL